MFLAQSSTTFCASLEEPPKIARNPDSTLQFACKTARGKFWVSCIKGPKTMWFFSCNQKKVRFTDSTCFWGWNSKGQKNMWNLVANGQGSPSSTSPGSAAATASPCPAAARISAAARTSYKTKRAGQPCQRCLSGPFSEGLKDKVGRPELKQHVFDGQTAC